MSPQSQTVKKIRPMPQKAVAPTTAAENILTFKGIQAASQIAGAAGASVSPNQVQAANAKISLGLTLSDAELAQKFGIKEIPKVVTTAGIALGTAGFSELVGTQMPLWAAVPTSAMVGFQMGKAVAGFLNLGSAFGNVVKLVGAGFGAWSAWRAHQQEKERVEKFQRQQAEEYAASIESTQAGLQKKALTLRNLEKQSGMFDKQEERLNVQIANLGNQWARTQAEVANNMKQIERFQQTSIYGFVESSKHTLSSIQNELANSGIGYAGVGWMFETEVANKELRNKAMLYAEVESQREAQNRILEAAKEQYETAQMQADEARDSIAWQRVSNQYQRNLIGIETGEAKRALARNKRLMDDSQNKFVTFDAVQRNKNAMAMADAIGARIRPLVANLGF